ncbi:hypothetical protein MnTg02_02277 [bacterium MnTg02]|nr:hypothetical protein MnTg02_02277 [bacterium MnTg02]
MSCLTQIREPVGDTFVAVDAGFLFCGEEALVMICGAFALLREVHEFEVMAVAALQRVVRLEPIPFAQSQL